MIKYKAIKWKNTIEAVEVVKETAQFVVIECTTALGKSTYREAKASDYSRHFDSWAEAHQYHVDRITSSIKATEAKLAQLNSELAEVNEMKDPSAK